MEIPLGAVLIRVRSTDCPDGRVPVVDEGVGVADGAIAGAVDVGGTVVLVFLSFGGFTVAGGFSAGTAGGAAVVLGGNGSRCSALPPEGLTVVG